MKEMPLSLRRGGDPIPPAAASPFRAGGRPGWLGDRVAERILPFAVMFMTLLGISVIVDRGMVSVPTSGKPVPRIGAGDAVANTSANLDTAARTSMRRWRYANAATTSLGLIACCAAGFLVARISAQLQASHAALSAEAATRQRLEETRVQLWEKLVVVQEEERRRLSRELHDQMAQDLSALLLGLKSLGSADASPERAQRLTELQAMAGQLIGELRTVAYELRPVVLEELGLQAGLTHYVEEWSRRSGVPVELVCSPDGFRLPASVEITLYRVVQEALSNVFKHARARSVSLIVECRLDEARLVVEDDGCGFNPADLSPGAPGQAQLGLRGMRERVTLAGGHFEVESAPGAGTTVIVRLPHTRPARVPV
jgi:signal transduction histidine kinase